MVFLCAGVLPCRSRVGRAARALCAGTCRGFLFFAGWCRGGRRRAPSALSGFHPRLFLCAGAARFACDRVAGAPPVPPPPPRSFPPALALSRLSVFVPLASCFCPLSPPPVLWLDAFRSCLFVALFLVSDAAIFSMFSPPPGVCRPRAGSRSRGRGSGRAVLLVLVPVPVSDPITRATLTRGRARGEGAAILTRLRTAGEEGRAGAICFFFVAGVKSRSSVNRLGRRS